MPFFLISLAYSKKWKRIVTLYYDFTFAHTLTDDDLCNIQ